MAAAGLSDAQIEEFREAFHLFDRNQDGTITSSNLANVLKVGIEFIPRQFVFEYLDIHYATNLIVK